MLDHIDARTKSKLELNSEVKGTTEFDLMVHSIVVIVVDSSYNDGKIVNKVHYFDGSDFPYRTKDNSMLITLDEIATFVINKTGTKSFQLHYNDAFIGAILFHGNYLEKGWTLHGITNGYA